MAEATLTLNLLHKTPDRPHGELTANGQVASVHHKNATGLATLELVHTPQGVVRVQRTFSKDGALLKETASLEGRPVALPRR